jgi:hypothetical protein
MKKEIKAVLYTFLIIFIIATILTLAFYYRPIAIRILLGLCLVSVVYAIYMIVYLNLKD